MPRTLSSVVAFVRLGRPQFLIGGFLLHGLGAAVAVAGGAPFFRRGFWLGQLAVTCIQLMTHYANDFFDVAADRANATPTRWSGGSRVLATAALSPRVAWHAARALALLSLVAILAVAAGGGPGGGRAAIALIGALALAWGYSAPPLRLHSRGLGELTTAVVVTGLVPVIGYVMQAHGFGAAAPLWCAIAPLFGLQFCMLLAVEFPDAVGDAAVDKRTLVVRLGGRSAAALYRACLVVIYGAVPLLTLVALPVRAGLAVWLMLPIAAWQFHRLGAGGWEQGHAWEGVAFRAVAMVTGTALAELLAFVCRW
ncbi:MAG TPA: prenyltransferase [Polyangia bacterium]|nr:prenyltransferase [Polyangia bacterium]